MKATGGIPEVTQQDIAKFSAAAGLTKEAPEPEQLSFLEQLEASESSGKADAEITIKDGKRFVGKLQFGKARLQDYQKVTGTTFTQDEFIKDTALQDKVATWHIADLDKAIDALGDAAASYDRDGLRAVAHLGGKSGMKKFVQSKGEYNPADELGTSLQSYYDKFAQRGDASCSIERFRYQRTTITTPAFGRAIAVGFASNAARMTYSGSYKHTGRLSGAVSAIIRNGGQYICVMQEQNHLLRCQ